VADFVAEVELGVAGHFDRFLKYFKKCEGRFLPHCVPSFMLRREEERANLRPGQDAI
jgi:hypothetical protein